MLKKYKFLFLIGLALFLFPSCATVISGSRQPLKINPGTDTVYVNGVIQENKDSIVFVKRRLFKFNKIVIVNETESITYDQKFNEVTVFNFIFIPFWVVDFCTGSMAKYTPQNK